jgi:RimJ/RimL family protein N-acetyltransferase
MPPTPSIPSIIRTPRLVLRRQRPEDAPLIKEAVDASLAHLQASVAWARSAPTPLRELEARLAESAAAFDAGEAWAFTLLDLAETRVLGCVGLERGEPALVALVGQHTMETGYWLRADSTGRGYATEATAALVELAFTSLGARRVAICHDPANIASAGVPRRLGFRRLGTVSADALPGRLAADGSLRPTTTVWVLDAPSRA